MRQVNRDQILNIIRFRLAPNALSLSEILRWPTPITAPVEQSPPRMPPVQRAGLFQLIIYVKRLLWVWYFSHTACLLFTYKLEDKLQPLPGIFLPDYSAFTNLLSIRLLVYPVLVRLLRIRVLHRLSLARLPDPRAASLFNLFDIKGNSDCTSIFVGASHAVSTSHALRIIRLTCSSFPAVSRIYCHFCAAASFRS